MPDREKVISAFEKIINVCKEDGCDFVDLTFEDAGQILAQLKEQKQGKWIVLEFCANEGIYCSECHMKIFDRTTKPKKKLSQYCPHCGSRNDQFFRDGEVVFR